MTDPVPMLSFMVRHYGCEAGICITASHNPSPPSYIGGAYFFTSSTSFANPAVTVARMFSDTFAGIAPASAPGFVASWKKTSVAGPEPWPH